MNTYYYSEIERRNFGDLLTEEGVACLNILQVAEPIFLDVRESNTILAVWSANPLDSATLPEVLICKDGTHNDWAAWITTFASSIRPFSSHIRLLTQTDFVRNMNRPSTPRLRRYTQPLSGLVLGEVLGASGMSDKALDTLPARVFASTLSFVMCRTAAIYPDFEDWSKLFDMWESVRTAMNQRDRSVNSLSVAHVCSTVLDAFGYRGMTNLLTEDDLIVSQVCQSLIRSPRSVPSYLLNNNSFAGAERMMHGSREDRVRAFQDFLKHSHGNSISKEEMSFMLGYLASRIAPGSIKHSSVLGQVTEQYPTAMLWYGFCSGFSEDEVNLPTLGRRISVELPSSARRVIREIFRPEPLISVPTCDIDYSELIAISRTGGDAVGHIMKTTPGAVVVELLPGVCTSMAVLSSKTSDSHARQGWEMTIIGKMGEEIERLRDLYRLLAGSEPGNGSTQRQSSYRRKKK